MLINKSVSIKKGDNTILSAAIVALVLVLLFNACSKEKPVSMSKGGAAPVTVVPVVRKTVPVTLRAIGNVEAYSNVAIKARVGGELMSVNFREGQEVAKGDLLFSIDPRPYEAALAAAKANLARDEALARKAGEDVVRYTSLVEEQLVSREDYDRVRTNAEALKATVDADRAAIDNARLQMEYCKIYAPVSGRAGGLLVDQGNLVRANDDAPLVVINQIQPVSVSFSVPEHDLREIKKYSAGGRIMVSAFISDKDISPADGELSFIDNKVDLATGMVTLKATFANRDKSLWPGQFISVVMTLAQQHDAVVAPSQAVQTGQQGQFVFVVKDDTAELRPVTTGISYEDLTVIEKGLLPGEQIVMDGQMRLFPGAKVEIKNK
ncbi:MAG: efflux RND transporter periplasmic adaptor subunit [Nitrospirota bacterium]|nr:efflux RND transporter periplasmic adaptor subunit [Nitrospirota bacterium]